MFKMRSSVILNFWDILQYKLWDKICDMKGLGEDFVFDSIYENDYVFEVTTDEAKQLGIKLK